MARRRDAYSQLLETLRWRVALVLALLISLLMVALGLLNTRLGLSDTAQLAWVILAVSVVNIGVLVLLPRPLGGMLFFAVIATLLAAVLVFSQFGGRPMHHWAYLFPPALVFILRPNLALVIMVVYGLLATAVASGQIPAIDVVRFSSGYGLLVCFIYTYALLQERAAAMLRYHSDHDGLSHCLNRRTFNEALQEIAEGGIAGQRCCFLLIDIDHFKAINDRYGHLVGDKVIIEIASRLRQLMFPGTPLYRYGGEEFAVILAASAERTGVALAESLREGVAEAPLAGVPVTISIGVAEWRQGQAGVTQALDRADQALYEAKHEGRNRVVAASQLQ